MEKKPFIFWLASWYPTRLDPFPGDFIQRHAKALALYHPVHVLHIAKDEDGVLTKNILIDKIVNGNLHETIVYYHPFKTGLSIVDRIISTRKFLQTGKKFINEIVADHRLLFIHLHVAMRHGLLAVWAKKTLGIIYVITEHWTGYDRSTYPAHLRPAKWYWLATNKIFKQALYFYPEVNRMGELINQTITSIPYTPISNSVDTTLFYPQSDKPDIDDTFHFIHVSTLSYQKNIDGMLRVMEKCASENSRFHFTLVGPVPTEIADQINNSAVLLKAVTLTGALPYHLVAEQMRKAHALLMFSRYENQPCVILEALCCGLPVVSTNVGGIAEVINETNGILIKSEQEEELYSAVKTMAKGYRRFNVADIASAATNAYSFETTGKQMLDCYKRDLPEFF